MKTICSRNQKVYHEVNLRDAWKSLSIFLNYSTKQINKTHEKVNPIIKSKLHFRYRKLIKFDQ